MCDLITVLNMEQSKISRHLAVLRKNGVVSSRKSGQWVHYKINEDLPLWASAICKNLLIGSHTAKQFESDVKALDVTKTDCEQL